ncbi:MAG TPA: penicillin acylase family protein [Candidatus Sulfopaludibacter sp.]|nr:penicillin acylase family protein [Candidatus Sulfopaludibacter sp.]
MATRDTLQSTSDEPSSPGSGPRKRPWLRVLLWALACLLVVLVVAVAVALWRLRSETLASLPVLDGEIHLAALSAPVTVRRDAHGVPHLEAAGQDDLFIAQGYLTAQDRLWQMDLYRRNANGELAEILGASLVNRDIAQRVFGYRNTARRIYDHLPADDHRRLEDYARGVNLFITQHQDTLPVEFRLLMYKPQPWSGADSISIAMMMVDMLDTHWDVKLAREKIAAKLNNPKLEADLYPVGSWRDHPPTGEVVDLTQPRPAPPPASDNEDDDRTQARGDSGIQTRPSKARTGHPGLVSEPGRLRALLGLPDCDGCAAGSNNWVISGKHTASGKPLLSNDMHLGLSSPNIWYMADLRAPGFHAAGVTLPGMPLVIAGHNEHIAWGFTAMYGDVQDLYVEKLDGKGNYQANDATWKPLAIDHEVIHVRGKQDVEEDVRSTEHGPLINPILSMLGSHEGRAIALKWTLYDSTLNSIPLFAMNTATNWAEFSTALAAWYWPTQNVVYADDHGHIAYHGVGKIPIRAGGLVSVPVEDAQHEWTGYIAFEAMPNTFDPPSGFLATANSRVTSEKFPAPVTLEWADPYRTERIYKLLQGRDGLAAKDMIPVQTDVYSESDQELAHRFAYAIDHTAGADDRLHKAADIMRSWDGRLTADSAAASLVTSARAVLRPMILEPRLGDLAHEYHWSESNFAEEEIVMHGNADWLPPGYKDWDAVLTEAVRRGMGKTREHPPAPGDVTRWAYGSWHVVDIEHPLASLLPVIGRIAGTGPQPLSGDTITVKQVGRAFGPSQRFTMDWSNIDGSTENIVLGEGSNPYSPYFRDQWDDYYHGTTFALPFSQAAVAAQTRHTLRLTP